ncbi:lasso RiPP family leader peptide-containing protein [Nocardiopsis sp. CNT-189]|nr:lasso RiPP family leader peptide-containing protein [Nocardiopsis potens]
MENAMEVYEPPEFIEIGDFAELTRLTRDGNWVDSPGWGWWL